ncbi:PBPb domain-containing protein [Aphelenchoides besseyi]|nr:PBPb domain-containing protein [Aphelenchoides besseyi]
MTRPKIRVLFARNPPDAFDNCNTFPTMQPYMQCPFPGWCVEIIKQLADYLNYDIEPVIANTRVGELNWGMYDRKTGLWDGALGFLSNGSVDTLCLFYQRTTSRAQHFDYSYPIMNVRPNYIVHSTKNYLASNIWNAFTPYDNYIWITILVFLIVQIAFLLFVARTEVEMKKRTSIDVPEIIWDLFRLQLYQPFQVDFWTLGGKNFMEIEEMISCRLFLDMYQNVLLSALLTPTDQRPFSDPEQLVSLVAANKYSLITNYHGNWYFEELETSNNSHFRRLREATLRNKVKIVSTVEEALDYVEKGNYIFPIQQDGIAALYAHDRCNLEAVPNEVTEKSSHLMFRKNSELLGLFNHAIVMNLDFVRRTFLKYFELKFKISRKTRHCADVKGDNNRKPLDMPSLFGVVVVCVAGLVLSLVAFAAEFYVSWQHRMIRLRIRTRRAMAEPLHLMALAQFGTTAIYKKTHNQIHPSDSTKLIGEAVCVLSAKKSKRLSLTEDSKVDR